MQTDSTPMISLVIPTIGTTNHKFVDEALSSAINTSVRYINQIIISDDSRDTEFRKTLELWQARDNRILIVPSESQLTIAGNWNLGLSQVKNPWVLFLHDDDVLYHDELPEIMSCLDEELGFVSFDFNCLINSTKKRVSRYGGIDGIMDNTPKFISTIYNTHKLREIGCWDDNAGYALDLFALVILHQQFGSNHHNILLGSHRLHDDNASSHRKRDMGYVDFIPYILTKLFPYLKDSKIRRKLVFHLASYSFPPISYKVKLTNRILRKFGVKAWFLDAPS